MAKKPSLILHIGHPKSGSTTIQAFVSKNWRTLREQGFVMPALAAGDVFEPASKSIKPNNPIVTLQNLRAQSNVGPMKAWIYSAHDSGLTPFISSECLIDPYWAHQFSGLSSETDIHILYYVRRQDQLLMSAWRQWGLKRGLNLQKFISRRIENRQPDFNAALSNWLDITPAKSVTARFIENRFLDGLTLTRHVSNYFGLNPDHLKMVKNQNESMDARLLLFMSARPEMFTSVHDDAVLQLLTSVCNEPIQKLWLSEQEFSQIQETFEPLNQLFLQRFHHEKAGTSVIDRKTAPVSSLPLPDRSEQEKLVQNCIAQLISHPDPRLQRLRQELKR